MNNGELKEEIIKVSFKDTPDKCKGKDYNHLIFGSSGIINDVDLDAFRESWLKFTHNNGFMPINTDYKMNYFNSNERYPSNTEMLKRIFPIQDEQQRHFIPHSENFELELKRFFAFGRRRSGRTTMLARVLVETAIETERPIRVVDHYIDERVGRDNIHHVMMQIDRIINEYRHKGCPVGVRKFDRHNGIISLFVQPEFLGEYEKLRIENNPTKFEVFPTEDLKRQLEKVKQQKKLLLIRKRRLS